MTVPVVLVVLAKAPEAGRVKTRLTRGPGPTVTPAQAADLAAAALLDTLDAAAAVPGARVVVALTGRVEHAARADAVRAVLARTTVVVQRGTSLGERIAAAHADAAVPGRPTLQVGMDTPQLTAGILAAAAAQLADADAVLGPAADGGWWALGLRDPGAAALIAGVPTSRADTGGRTLDALRSGGLRVGLLPELTDVDRTADALAVAALAPHGRFAAAVAGLTAGAAR